MAITGNPMMDMQREQIVGTAYNVLLRIKNGHFNLSNIDDWSPSDRLHLLKFKNRRMVVEDRLRGCWELLPAGVTELAHLQACMEEIRAASGNRYGSVDIPKEQLPPPGLTYEEVLTTYIDKLMEGWGFLDAPPSDSMKLVIDTAKRRTLEEIQDEHN